MRTLAKVSLALVLSVAMTQSFAIQVNVQSNASKIDGLGFTANGSKHGGLGSSYQGDGMPKGTYTFGLRAHGKDIPCPTKDGKRSVKITKNTTAMLKFNGRRCTANLSSE
jgi:hypothetical protein